MRTASAAAAAARTGSIAEAARLKIAMAKAMQLLPLINRGEKTHQPSSADPR